MGRSGRDTKLIGNVGVFGGWVGDGKLRRNDRFTTVDTGGREARGVELAGRFGMGAGV